MEILEGMEHHTEACVERSLGGLWPVFYMHKNVCKEDLRGICVFSVCITEWQRDGVGGSGRVVPR